MAVRQSAVESMAVSSFADIYRDRRVLVTGHTGFKGTWLTQWLVRMGARVTGIALEPETTPAHWTLLSPRIEASHIQDIRDRAAVERLVTGAAPEIVFHMAAQPLVRRSYRDPEATWATNVMGTLNVLEAVRRTPSVRAAVVVTTDKCYENLEMGRAYGEDDKLGGHDPYSASKAGAELVAASYRQSFFHDGRVLLASARAGNVIGGGDWSEDRLIPDLVRAAAERRALSIRSPKATRPWQHVLEPLAGYLLLGKALLEGRGEAARAWNFGPDDSANRTVDYVLGRMQQYWPDIKWEMTGDATLHEAQLLHLNSERARRALGWAPHWPLDACLEQTAIWYRAFLQDGTVLTDAQIDAYVCGAQAQGAAWAA